MKKLIVTLLFLPVVSYAACNAPTSSTGNRAMDQQAQSMFMTCMENERQMRAQQEQMERERRQQERQMHEQQKQMEEMRQQMRNMNR